MESTINNNNINSVKVSFDNELRRFAFEGYSFQSLYTQVIELFGLAKDADLFFRYLDNEGDKITMSSDRELKEGLQISKGLLHLNVTRKDQNKAEVVDSQNQIKDINTEPAMVFAPEKPRTREEWRQMKIAKKLEWQQRKEQARAEREEHKGERMEARWGRFHPHRHGFMHHRDGCGQVPDGVMPEYGPKLIARHVKDVTVQDGTEIPAGTAFVKTWRLRNEGPAWPAGCRLLFVSRNGDNMNGPESVPVPSEGPVQPSEEVDISVNLVAPAQPGRYIGFWRLCTPEGRKFGQRVWVSIVVPGSSSDDSAGGSPWAASMAKYGELADTIIQMGFDVKKCRVARMLARCDGDVDKVVQILTKRGKALVSKEEEKKA